LRCIKSPHEKLPGLIHTTICRPARSSAPDRQSEALPCYVRSFNKQTAWPTGHGCAPSNEPRRVLLLRSDGNGCRRGHVYGVTKATRANATAVPVMVGNHAATAWPALAMTLASLALAKPTSAHLTGARARKASTGVVSVSAREMKSVRSEKREQLLREDGPQVKRGYPSIALGRRGNEPSCSIDLRMAIVVVCRFNG
jgi:hypothetical protein